MRIEDVEKKVIMDEADINEACVEWLKTRHDLVVKDGIKHEQCNRKITIHFEVINLPKQPYRG